MNRTALLLCFVGGCAGQLEPLPPSKPCELPDWKAPDCYSMAWGEPAAAGETPKPGWLLTCPQADGSRWVLTSTNHAIHYEADATCDVDLTTGSVWAQ